MVKCQMVMMCGEVSGDGKYCSPDTGKVLRTGFLQLHQPPTFLVSRNLRKMLPPNHIPLSGFIGVKRGPSYRTFMVLSFPSHLESVCLATGLPSASQQTIKRKITIMRFNGECGGNEDEDEGEEDR